MKEGPAFGQILGGQIVVDKDVDRRIRGLKRLVGNTPLLAIDFTFRGRERVLYAKAAGL